MKEETAQQYARLKRRLWLTDLTLTLGLALGSVASGLAQTLRDQVVGRFWLWPLQVAVFTGILGLGMTLLTFPLDWYRSFRIEHQFNLSTQRFSQWLTECAKRWVVGGILGLLLIEGLSFLLRAFPKNWWQAAAFAWMMGSVLMTRLFPILLIPIFYRQRPLADDHLKGRLTQLLRRCQARVNGIFEIDLSRTTRKANACLCGMGRTRRVLMSDTLLKAYPPEEIEVVLAHEVGHDRMKHLWVAIGIGTAAVWVSSFALARLLRGVDLTDLAALPLLGLGFLLANLGLMPLVNGLSRWMETQADRFALDQTGNPAAFIAAMRRLAQQNLAEFNPPRWVEFLFYDHPPIAKRIALAQVLMNNKGDKQ